MPQEPEPAPQQSLPPPHKRIRLDEPATPTWTIQRSSIGDDDDVPLAHLGMSMTRPDFIDAGESISDFGSMPSRPPLPSLSLL